MSANHSASHPLRAWREAANLTQEQAGELIDVHGTTFGKYELGLRQPRRNTLAKIIQVTGGKVTANDFIVPPEALRAAE